MTLVKKYFPILLIISLSTASHSIEKNFVKILNSSLEFHFIEIQYEDMAPYHSIVRKIDEVEINLQIDTALPFEFSQVKIYIDNKSVYNKKQTSKDIVFHYKEAGKHKLKIELCNHLTCIYSHERSLTIVDTTGNNKPTRKLNKKSQKIIAGYLNEWDVYARNYDVTQLPSDQLTHVIYSSLAICGPTSRLQTYSPRTYERLRVACEDKENFDLVILDSWASLQKQLPKLEEKTPIKGVFGQLLQFSNDKPNVQIIASIGGWELSEPLFLLGNNEKRQQFVNSTVEFLKTWKFFDGIDIQWIKPSKIFLEEHNLTREDVNLAYKNLAADLKDALKLLTKTTKKSYQLITSIEPYTERIQYFDHKAVTPHIDYLFLKGFDLKGPWSKKIGHYSNLFNNQDITTVLDNIPLTISESIDNTIQILTKSGINKDIITLGVAGYGRGWQGKVIGDSLLPLPETKYGIRLFDENERAKIYEPGRIEYKGIVDYILDENDNGFVNNFDKLACASYIENQRLGIFISYESPRSIDCKMKYIDKNKLSGIFIEGISGDNGNLINATITKNRNPLTPKNNIKNYQNNAIKTKDERSFIYRLASKILYFFNIKNKYD